MPFRSVDLPAGVPGTLWLSSMPGRLEPWASFLGEARQAGLQHVVCLTPLHEVRSLSPDYHAAITAGTLPFHWTSVEMRNFGIALTGDAFSLEVVRIATALRQGDSVLLHCAAGIGRTGTTAACVLKALGLDRQEALRSVQRAGSNPESAEQTGLIDRF
jgi:protein-tyrosine phosphatase